MERSSRDSSPNTDSSDAREKSPFLDGSVYDDHEAPFDKKGHHGSRRCYHCSFVYWSGILLFQLIFTIVIMTAVVQRLWSPQSTKATNGQNLSLNVLRPAVSYSMGTSPQDWWQQPLYTDLSSESGMAWRDLMSNEPFRISREEMSHYNIPTSLWEGKELDSGGFPAVLGVYHGLHCVRHIKQELFKEYYFPGRTAEAAEARVEHTKHCLEVLRQSVMCYPDLAPLPLLWDLKQNTSYVKPDVARQCMNWESLLEGTKGRAYGYDEIIPKDL